MIRLIFDTLDAAGWSQLAYASPESNLLQTWAYGEAKARSGPWRVERALIVDGENEIGVVQAFVRRIPLLGGGLAWINRGPLLSDPFRNEPRLWYDVLEAMRAHWVGKRRMILRVALPHQHAADVDPIVPAGFRFAEFGGGAHSARLDLREPLDALRRQLEQKWRHGLNKAERAGAGVESGAADRLFRAIIAEYSAMLDRKSFRTSVTPELLVQLQHALPAEQKLWSVIAREGDEVAGFVLIARYGDTAEYLAGSSNAVGRKWNAGNLLLWRAITEMKEQGYRWFDAGGMDPNRTPPGIYHFKAGLNAKPYHLPDEIEAYRPGLRSFALRRLIAHARRSAAE